MRYGPSGSSSAASRPRATIEVVTVGALLRAGCGRALGGLLLGLPLVALAQAPPSEQELLERLRALRGELGAGATADGQLLTPQEVEQAVAERLGVEVLSSERVDTEGGTRYAVKVMNPPGDYSAAFLVTTLLVDAASGDILGEARPDSGLVRPVLPSSESESGLEARRRTYR
jgi:hypothetical protein